MEGMIAHEKFLEKTFIHKEKLRNLYKHTCGNLNSYTLNYSYWKDQYDLVVQLNHVINWRERNGLLAIGRINEKILNDELIIFDE